MFESLEQIQNSQRKIPGFTAACTTSHHKISHLVGGSIYADFGAIKDVLSYLPGFEFIKSLIKCRLDND